MYLRDIRLTDIKCFDEIALDFSSNEEESQVRRWTVILGENGLGKSTLLQSMAVPLAGPGATRELLPVADGWVRRGASFGKIHATLLWTEGDAQLPRWPKKSPYRANFVVTGPDLEALPAELREQSTVPAIFDWHGGTEGREREVLSKEMSRLKKTAYAEGKPGWLACGYGPFRRLSGGSQDADRILYSGRRSARFVTLFREDAALTSATEWLIGLHNTARDGDDSSARALDLVREAFRNEFLREPAEIHVDARSARLQLQGQLPIPFSSLSDGYRSMLALGIDLLRWLIQAYPQSEAPLHERGVVLIDELDAHLHPAWQRAIGTWLLNKFSRLQFIVATHSPFLAQVRPSGNIVLEKKRSKVVANLSPRDVADWRVDQILTELFGLPDTRSPAFSAKLKEYLDLHKRKQLGGLGEKDAQRVEQLELWARNLPPGIEDPAEREVAQSLRRAVSRFARKIEELE